MMSCTRPYSKNTFLALSGFHSQPAVAVIGQHLIYKVSIYDLVELSRGLDRRLEA
jgi:hypothetical protein